MLFVFLYSILHIKKSIVFILPLFYMAICIYTYLGTEFLEYAKNVPFQLYEKLDNHDQLYYPYIIASISFIFGVKLSIKKKIKEIGGSRPVIHNIYKKKTLYILGLYITVLILLHLGNGAGHLYHRYGYTLNGSGIPMLRILYTMFLPFLCLLLPFLKQKNLRVLLLIILFILIQGTSSRNLIMIPACYYIGTQIRDKKFNLYKACIAFVTIIFGIALVMESRNQVIQGVIPNLLYVYNNGIDFTFLEIAINYLSSYSIFATGITLQDHSFNIASFLSSINPLPSSFLNIEYMIDTQKLNRNSPFPAIAMLALGGFLVVSFYYFIAGFIWQFLYNFVSSNSKMLLMFLFMLFVLFTILSTQYNLRGVTRFLYYVIFLCLLIKIQKIIKFNWKLVIDKRVRNRHAVNTLNRSKK